MPGKRYSAAQRAAFGKRMAQARARKTPRRTTTRRRAVSGMGSYRRSSTRRVTSRRVSGRGAYNEQKSMGGILGDFGHLLGNRLGGFLGSVTGLGKYDIKKNTILAPDPPVVSNTSSGVRIKHREYIQDILSSTGFVIQVALPIQPGLALSFPWVAGIAGCYQQYKLHGVLYEFITTCGNAIAGTNNSLGEVSMATIYNATAPLFINKQQMLQEEFGSSQVPSKNLIHGIECSPSKSVMKEFFVRTGAFALNSGQDLRLFDAGIFQLATQGMQQAGVAIGELYVTYDIEFLKPQLNIFGNAQLQSFHLQMSNTWTSLLPLGTTGNVVAMDSFGLTLTSTTITFPKGFTGKYMLAIQWFGSGTAAVIPPLISTNTPAFNLFSGDANNSISAPSAASTSSTASVVRVFNITDASQATVLTFATTGVLPSPATAGDIIITQLSTLMVT